MRHYLSAIGLLAIVFHACSPVPTPVIPTPEAASLVPAPTTPEIKPLFIKPNSTLTKPTPTLPEQAKITPRYQQFTRNGITLSLVKFDDRNHHLRVADQAEGTGSQWRTAQEAGHSYNALAAINGGFFTPEGKPLGIVIENGTRRGSLNRSSLGAGMISSSPSGSSIFRKDLYSTGKHSSGNLLQTGPMLAERSRTTSGLSKSNNRYRSFIAWDGNHHWIIGYASPCSLHELSQAIAGKTLAGVKINTAINLDGGRSSDLWVGNKVSSGGKTHRSFLNKTVRNYLVLIKN